MIDLDELLFIRNGNLNLIFSSRGNPYHDILGKFTWSPFGKYKGNYREAISIWGNDYKQIMKSYDVNSLTQEELDMIDSYLASPQIGNSYDKNGSYTTTNYFTDNEGNELTGDQLKEAQELYDLYWGSKSWDLSYDEQQKFRKEFEEKGYHIDRNYLRPSIQFALFNEKTMSQPDIYQDTLTLYNEAKKIKPSENYGSETDLQKSARLYIEWFENLKKYAEDDKGIYSQSAKDSAKKILSGEAKAINTLKYGNDKSSYITPSYQSNKWNSDAVGVSAVELSSWPESKIQKYIDFYSKNSRDSYLTNILKSELTSRQFDKLISEKGVSLDHDVVVTRRIKDRTLIEQELKYNGYFIQEGFTSTTAANNIAKKSPGNMVFGDNVLKIVIPAGTKFLPVEPAIRQKLGKDDESTMALTRQHEIILPSKTKYISGNSEYKNNLENLEYKKDQFSDTLELDKVLTNSDAYSLIAITDEYQKGH